MTSTFPLRPWTQADSVLPIRTATAPLEFMELRTVLDQEHFFKGVRPAGHALQQATPFENGSDKLVAGLRWTGAAEALRICPALRRSPRNGLLQRPANRFVILALRRPCSSSQAACASLSGQSSAYMLCCIVVTDRPISRRWSARKFAETQLFP